MSGPDSPVARLLARHRALIVFGAIGVANTLLHSATVVAVVESALAGPVPANVAGFAVANTASFFANCRFTFGQPPSWRRYRTFLAVSLLSLALTIGLSALAEALHWHYLAGLLLVLLCGPVLTYMLHKAFTFRQPA
ncbi:GtrA family protein [Massilia sp. YIM B02763]|uniref:GtrA family protein n=1 Tax=Massilia sp. YIM B02763 TaxID=3050130 RepID=UPI0025B72F5C|nr:GtrA family protein [Massilia sp. YIM B02763]MDN4054651.1 GtrA family protein [Massilia sp. YIM B02763]